MRETGHRLFQQNNVRLLVCWSAIPQGNWYDISHQRVFDKHWPLWHQITENVQCNCRPYFEQTPTGKCMLCADLLYFRALNFIFQRKHKFCSKFAYLIRMINRRFWFVQLICHCLNIWKWSNRYTFLLMNSWRICRKYWMPARRKNCESAHILLSTVS